MHQSVTVLPSQNFEVSPSYKGLVQTRFGGNIQSLTYTEPQDAIDTINRLVQEQTRDQVQELVNNLDPQTQLLLATAASYQSMFQLLLLKEGLATQLLVTSEPGKVLGTTILSS